MKKGDEEGVIFVDELQSSSYGVRRVAWLIQLRHKETQSDTLFSSA
jgi:hypothetical protein